MSNIFFTSDHHFFHNNIIKYCNRPFNNVEEMNESIIENHNKLVRKTDNVWFLGDFCWKGGSEILNRLNGVKHLVIGNHDNPEIYYKFSSHQFYKELKVDSNLFVLCHYPIMSWNKMRYKSVHLHGHCHGTLDNKNSTRIDVGVDVHNFTPVHIDEILKLTKDAVPPTPEGDYHK